MAENVNGLDLFGSGGHRWAWGPPAVTEKKLGTAGTIGEAGIRTHVGSATVRVAGVLKAADNAALTALEQAIEQLAADRTACTWEDDIGNTGEAMVVVEYQRSGQRQYGTGTVWQFYTVTAEERHAGPFVT